MVSGQDSIPSSKHGINLATATPREDRSRNNLGSNVNPASLPLPASNIGSCSPPNLPGSNIPDCAVVHGVPSTDYHNSIDKDDIVIAYVFLELHFISLITHSTRVMGPTGTGKSSVSYSSLDPTVH